MQRCSCRTQRTGSFGQRCCGRNFQDSALSAMRVYAPVANSLTHPIGSTMTRGLDPGARLAGSTRGLLSHFKTGVARALEWSRKLRAGLLATRLESDATPHASRQHGFGFVYPYSDAELQIMLAELRYPHLPIPMRQGARRGQT